MLTQNFGGATKSRGLFSTREREEDSKHRTRENRCPRGEEKQYSKRRISPLHAGDHFHERLRISLSAITGISKGCDFLDAS